MLISISNVVESTNIFIAIFVLAIVLSIRKKQTKELFPNSLSQEIKGLAILTVIFCHVGYFLVSDNRFLFPLSTMAGVGVNLFLFLSGYGQIFSATKRQYTILQFYKNNLLKLFVPFWITLGSFFVLDYFVLHKFYGWTYMAQNFIGYFPKADLYVDVNSPFWYFTFILLYYLVFPLVFIRRAPWLSAIIIYYLGILFIKINPAQLAGVIGLYKVHITAFPLGMLVGYLFLNFNKIKVWLLGQVSEVQVQTNLKKYFYLAVRYIILIGLAAGIAYTAYYSNVGNAQEENTSLITVGLIILFALLKNFDIKLLYWFGFYSYEIYLFHWPLMIRYDYFYHHLPAWLATVLYLALFMGLGWCLRKLSTLKFGKMS